MEEKKNFYALHAVIFKKKNGWTLEKAEEEVNNFIKTNKKHFYRETKSSFRFRNIPKQKFISKTFRTKNLKNGISLIMGELKPEARHLEGAGIFDLFKKPIKAVKEFFSPRQGFNNTTTKNLNAFGNIEVKSLTIVRTPIMGILDKALNLISFGKWATLKKEYGHDKLFHLALIANLGNKNLVIEKNEVINVNTSYKMGKESETMDVDLKGKKFTINQMLDATKSLMGEKNFYSYDGLKNNCQTFIKSCLMSMGLYDAEENNFVFQDLSELAKKFPSISKKIMNATTNLGAVVNKLTGQGEGVEQVEINEISQFTLKQLKKVAEAFNKHMNIVIGSKTKKELVEELEKHLEVVNGELALRPHVFEIMKKGKKDIEVEVEIKKMQEVLDVINEELMPLEVDVKKARQKLKEDYKKEFGGENIDKILSNINNGIFGIKEINELKKKFNQPTKKDLIYFLESNTFYNYKRRNLKLPERQKYKNLKRSKEKLIKNITPENVKRKLDIEKNEKRLKQINNELNKMEEDFNKKMEEKYGVNLTEKINRINYLKFTGIKYASGNEEKELKTELANIFKELKKKFKLKTNESVIDFLHEKINIEDLYSNEKYKMLNEEKRQLVKDLNLNPLYGEGKKSLEDEFKMDEKDHEKKLDEFEKSNPSNEDIKETLAGLKSITESGMNHIKKLEEMLELEGGSAKSAGFIRAIMARKKAEEEGKETTRDEAFKKYKNTGFKEQKLNKSSKDLVDNVFEDGIYKKLVLNFAILGANYLYNTKGIRDLYNKEPEKAKKAVETIEETLGDEKKVLDALKKQVPNYNELTETEKIIYMMNYKQAVRASIMSKYFEGMKPIEVEITEELKERMKQNYIRWYNKNKKSKKPPKTTEYNELLEKIENLQEGDELELPVPTKGKKETIKKLKDEVKEVKRKRTNENEPSKERKAVDDALLEYMKRQKVPEKKKPSDDDFEDLLAENGLTMEDLENI